MSKEFLEQSWQNYIEQITSPPASVPERSTQAAEKLAGVLVELLQTDYGGDSTDSTPSQTSHDYITYGHGYIGSLETPLNGKKPEIRGTVSLNYKSKLETVEATNHNLFRRRPKNYYVPSDELHFIRVEAEISHSDVQPFTHIIDEACVGSADNPDKVVRVERGLAGIAELLGYHYCPVEAGFADLHTSPMPENSRDQELKDLEKKLLVANERENEKELANTQPASQPAEPLQEEV